MAAPCPLAPRIPGTRPPGRENRSSRLCSRRCSCPSAANLLEEQRLLLPLDTRTPASGHRIHCSRQGCLLLVGGSTPSITVLRSRWGSAASPVPTAPPGGCATAWPSLLGSSTPSAVSTYQTNASRHGGKHAFSVSKQCHSGLKILRMSRNTSFSFYLHPFPIATSSQDSSRRVSKQGMHLCDRDHTILRAALP